MLLSAMKLTGRTLQDTVISQPKPKGPRRRFPLMNADKKISRDQRESGRIW